MHIVAGDMGIINEEDLRLMSRKVKQSVPTDTRNSEAINKLISTVDSCFLTASSPELHASHRVASWNVLCAYIEQCSVLLDQPDSPYTGLSGDIWARGFNLYLNYALLARPKSSRQLLVTLTTVLKRRMALGDHALAILRQAVSENRSLFLQREDQGKIRAYSTALTQLLAKDVLGIEVLLDECSSEQSTWAPTDFDSRLGGFLRVLFGWMAESDMASTFAPLISTILDKYDASSTLSKSRTQAEPIWANPLIRLAHSSLLEPGAFRSHLLPVLFKRDVKDYGYFLTRLETEKSSMSINTLDKTAFQELFLISLQAGKDAGLLQEFDAQKIQVTEEAVYMPVRNISLLLLRSSRSARLTGLSLLISSPSATKPFHRTTLQLLKRHLSHYFADTDTNFRGEVFSLMQRFLDRSRAITAVLARQAQKPSVNGTESYCAEGMLGRYRRFFSWFLKFILWQLRPTAAYQRHISALKCLAIIVRSGLDRTIESGMLSKSALGNTNWPFHISVRSRALQRALLDLTVDPFDDVRQTASTILDYICSSPVKEYSSLDIDIRQALVKAEAKMLSTGRADQADGVSHLYFLLSRIAPASENVLGALIGQLQTMLSVAEHDLQMAVEKYPLHGLLTSIARTLETPDAGILREKGIAPHLVACLHRVWKLVKPILCDDAPEGYLPETVEETSGVTTKDTLSFCWRALKEASLLLGKLIATAAQASDMAFRADLHNLCFEQLAELRHRGAFSTVAQTWSLCCSQIARSTTDSSSSGLEHWYGRVLTILRNRTTINTRRSAGLPSLLCGILIADERDVLLQKAFTDLDGIARAPVERMKEHESSLTQVHAMNCLKDILKNSKLGEKSESFLPSAMKLAADALQSKSWAVRNCGLMLFRGVIDRLLGTSHAYLEEDSAIRKSVALQHQSGIFEVVLGLLSTSDDSSSAHDLTSAEGVFPALQLLQRLQLSDEYRGEAVVCVKRLLGSPSWHVRDKAARTYANLVGLSGIEDIATLLQAQSKHNVWHGNLLSARHIVTRAFRRNRSNEDLTEGSQLLSVVLRLLSHLLNDLPSLDTSGPVIQGAWLDVITECLTSWHCTDADQGDLALIQNHITELELTSKLETLLGASKEGFQSNYVARLATARLWATSLSLGLSHQGEVASLAALLCILDGDTGADFFATLCDRLPSTSRSTLSTLESVQEACYRVLPDSEVSMKAKVQAQNFLLALSRRAYEEGDDHDAIPSEAIQADLGTREYVNNTFQLRLLHLNSALEDTQGAYTSLRDLERLIEDLQVAVAETSDGLPFSREVAAYALAKLPVNTFWTSIRSNPHLRNALAIVLYDLLHDDDEDIRLLGTTSTSKLLDDSTEVVPQVAAHNLIPFLLSDPNTILTRAFSNLSTSVSHSLAEFSNPDTALFAEEKQNLYIDTAREVHFWSRCAFQLPPHAVPSACLRQLSIWTLEGLGALKEKAEIDHDGPLGWTSDADIFTLGLRVFYAAEFLLSLARRERRIGVRPSSVRRLLGELIIVGDKADLTPIWREEIERIWRAATVEHFQGLSRRLQVVGKE